MRDKEKAARFDYLAAFCVLDVECERCLGSDECRSYVSIALMKLCVLS